MNTHRHADTESLAQTTRNRSPRKHVRDRGPSLGPGDLTPPSSDSQRETEVPRMLMSPPPEETLRVSRARTNSSPDKRTSGSSRRSRDHPSSPSRTTKRKRNHIPSLTSHDEGAVASSSRVTLEATPNPKPRKQHRRQTSSIEAPTTPTKSPSRASVSPSKRSLHRPPRADNPQADYLPSIPLHDGERTTARHRSQTPLPHYEPPPERFTPPREILYTPVTAVSKSSKRKTAPPKSQQKSRRLTLQIKTEPPPIDLNAPPPPPSPSDDPLLLYGPKRRTRPPRASMSSVRSRDTPPISSSPVHILHQEDEPIAELDFHAMDVDTDDDEGNVLPVFNFPTNDAALDAPWSDDDEPNEEFEHTGEYTGRFMMLKVPTKMDPPSSATKQRMDQWGRPISPFPLPKKPSSGFARPYSPIPESPPRGEEAPELPIADDDVHELAIAEDRDLPVSPTPQQRDSPLFSHQDYDSVEEDPTEQRYSSPISPEQPHIDQDGYENDEAQVSDPQDDATQEVEDEVDILPDRTDGGDEFLVPIAGDDSSDLDYGEYNPPVVEEPVLADESSRQADAQPPVLQNQSPDEAASIEEDPGTVASATVTAIHSGIDIPTTEGGSLEERQHLATRVIPDIHVPPSSSTDIVYPNVAQQPNDSTSGPRPTTLETLGPGPSRVEYPDSTHATVADVPTQDEWSFAIPENVGEQDEDADLEDEEDAASVVRELSREPEDIPLKALPVSSLPAPSAVDSPQNPFQTQARSSERSVEPKQNLPNRLQTYPDPSFSLPDDDDEADLSLLDPSVVKITSNDPMAAARAAAILRLHKYDCIENLASPQKQDTSDVHSFVKGSSRKSLLQSGITKGNRRSSVHRSILSNGDTSLSDLLREAEATVLLEESHLHGLSPAHPKPAAPHKPLKTPGRSVSTPWGPLTKRSVISPKGPREWTKADWKQLDSCYTEERVALGEQRGLGVDELAPAEDVDPEKVIDRFMEAMGGEQAVSQLGPNWTRDDLLKRTRALRRKQAGGKVAPPSRRPSIVPADNLWTPAPQDSTLLSPNVSVLENRDAFSTPRQFPTRAVDDNPRDIEPKYAALLHEARPAAQEGESALTSDVMENSAARDETVIDSPHITPLLPGAPSYTLASKLKGLIFSYLPSPRSASPSKPPPPLVQRNPVLPAPPPEIFQKPRAPIKTPAPKVLPRPVAPKELVQLHPAPPKPSKIPRPASNPARVAHQTVPVSASARRDSGASVKDLVQTFETMEKMHADEREAFRKLESKRKCVQRLNESSGVSKLPKAVWRQ